jgi:hypothetical protein
MAGSGGKVSISKNIQHIREYTRSHPKLMRAHHFCYNLRLNKNDPTIDYFVMALNPGVPKNSPPKTGEMPLEETSEYDFHDHTWLTRPAERWRKLCVEIPRTDRVLLAECFFWSSSTVSEMETLYGPGVLKPENEYMQFCTRKNLDLISVTNPRAIIFPGLKALNCVPQLYDLEPAGTATSSPNGRGRLVVPYKDKSGRPWLFTKHWTGNWGINKTEKLALSACIAKMRF